MPRKNPRELAIDRVISHLENELQKVRGKIVHNRYEFRKLVDEQTVLKRERSELSALINDIKKKGPIAGKQLRRENDGTSK